MRNNVIDIKKLKRVKNKAWSAKAKHVKSKTCPIKTIREKILENYAKKMEVAIDNGSSSGNPDEHLLFDVVTQYVIENNWRYNRDTNPNHEDLLDTPHDAAVEVNCFDMADIIVELAGCIGFNKDNCFTIVINNFAEKASEFNEGKQESFDQSNLRRNEDGHYEFDVHCIAMINGYYFDPTLQVKYPLINNGVNIYNVLSFAIDDNNLEDFLHYLPMLFDINESTGDGWTLLHNALTVEKYDLARVLIEANANAHFVTADGLTPFGILESNLYEARRINDKKKLKEITGCLEANIAMINKNSAATTLQSLWRSYKARSSLLSIRESTLNSSNEDSTEPSTQGGMQPGM
jgi:hypothetical protein